MGCDSPLKGFRDRDTGGITFRRERGNGEKMEVGCGQCLGCRLDHSRMWAMRITHEASLHEYTGGNSFVTLTYRDERDCNLDQWNKGLHVPKDWSLHKSHFTAFMKRLRKAFPDNKIRYFYAGEYGRKCKHGIDLSSVGCPLCNTGRPHFHACLFNLSFEDLEAYESDYGITRYTSPTLERLWGYGFVDVGDLTYSSASYVARYILKKVGYSLDPYHYMTYDLEGEITFIAPEFIGMSRGNAAYKGQRCGIGARWYEKYKDDVFPSDEVPVPGHGVMKGVPRYYDEILRADNPELYEIMKATRKEFMNNHKEEYEWSRLFQKHKCKKARVKLQEERKLL
jgi:hypothetical protein